MPADQRAEFDRAARPALDALRAFQDFLQHSLALRNDYDWRLGRDLYTRKFRFALATGSDPSDVLEAAARRLQDVRAHMLALALPLHHAHVPRAMPDHAGSGRPPRARIR